MMAEVLEHTSVRETIQRLCKHQHVARLARAWKSSESAWLYPSPRPDRALRTLRKADTQMALVGDVLMTEGGLTEAFHVKMQYQGAWP